MYVCEFRCRAIKKTPGVDGLYIYVAPPSVAELEKRCRGRLKEAESTITKRVQWATQQVKASQDTMPVPGSGKKGGGSVPVVDFSIDNTTTDYVYDEVHPHSPSMLFPWEIRLMV
jgi:hypothetical protein